MPKIHEPLSEVIQFKCQPGLKKKFEAACVLAGLDKPAAGRLAIALFVKNGFSYGSENPPVKTGQGGG